MVKQSQDSLLPTLGEKISKARLYAMRQLPYWATQFLGLVIVERDLAEPDLILRDDWVGFADPRIGDWEIEVIATKLVKGLMHLWQRHAQRHDSLGVPLGDDDYWIQACNMEVDDDIVRAGMPYPPSRPPVLPQDHGMEEGNLAEEYFSTLISQRPELDPPPRNGSCQGPRSPDEGDGEDLPDGAGRSHSEQVQRSMEMAQEAASYADEHGEGSVMAGILYRSKKMLESKIDWKARLRSQVLRAVNYEKGHRENNWKRPARRQLGNVMMPTQRAPVPRVAVVVDTSGSMLHLLEQAMPEVQSILKASGAEVEYCQCDDTVHQLEQVRSTFSIKEMNFRGGGGTDFRPAFKALEELPPKRRPNVIVFITDGYGPAPEFAPRGMRTIWGMLGGTTPPAQWGESTLITVDSEEE